MRSLVFEGKTGLVYEELRTKDKKLHKNLCNILKEMLRSDPTYYWVRKTGTFKAQFIRFMVKASLSKG